MSTALTAHDVSVTLGQTRVLEQVNAQFAHGRWTCIVGPNGAGKSTLLKALAGLLPVQGSVQLQGLNLSDWPRNERAQTLAWMGQEPAAADDLSVEDVVLLGRVPHQAWLAPVSTHDRAQALLAMKSMAVDRWAERRLSDLSSGERQRVLIARALAVQAKVLLLDEPLAHLDMPHQVQWVRSIRSLVQQGVTVVSVLHELHIALLADEMMVMEQGKIVHHGQSQAASTHAALSQVFEQSFRVEAQQGQPAVIRIHV